MKAIKHLLWMLIALSMSISFASCGGDDDDGNQDIPTPAPGPGEGASELVGKWEDTAAYPQYNVGEGYELKADGSGIGFESNVSTDESYGTWGIRWSYKNDLLTIQDAKDKDDVYIYRVDYIDESVMRVTNCDEHGVPESTKRTFYRVKKFHWE